MSSVRWIEQLLKDEMKLGRSWNSTGDAHFLARFFFACYGDGLHIEQGHEEGESRLRALVLVHAVWMESVFAPAGHDIVERDSEVILAKKPTEYTTGFCMPVVLPRQPVQLETGRNCCAGFHRLLIESRSFPTIDENPI